MRGNLGHSCRRPGQQGGFSLLELAVVVAILGVLTMTALSAFENLEQVRRHNAARAHAEAARQALHTFALRNKRLPCPNLSDNGDTGFEGNNGSCNANANVGWLPYASLGLDMPVRAERLRYGVHRGTTDTDLVAPRRESSDQPDLERTGGFAAALARIASAAASTNQPHYLLGGTPDCSTNEASTTLINPAFVLVAPVDDRDGASATPTGFDGQAHHAFAGSSGTCVTPPDYPGDAGYDDVVVAESATTLLGWLMSITR
ncbi:type II secretion system protein [Stenotrophomonas daejeonensis]|uniref:type II secretion system protein n=1 Tax=Stenotrophomonas daejeonensis TaxID=659018 RepID=UPI0009FB36AD|nr:prepilin-type N-terminal cleavage/methylation domain-containing protein [Stenotrophomonas daejeonensis]